MFYKGTLTNSSFQRKPDKSAQRIERLKVGPNGDRVNAVSMRWSAASFKEVVIAVFALTKTGERFSQWNMTTGGSSESCAVHGMHWAKETQRECPVFLRI